MSMFTGSLSVISLSDVRSRSTPYCDGSHAPMPRCPAWVTGQRSVNAGPLVVPVLVIRSLSAMERRDDNVGSEQSPNKKQRSSGYVPSYMDPSQGPEPCVVCGDAATGYHYRCMTCEGCKGFFRRTIQKDLRYHCKFNSCCTIDKSSRNQCQQCRFDKCLRVGMAADLVLNDKQRQAKRKLIEENRERRRSEKGRVHVPANPSITAVDRDIIDQIRSAYLNGDGDSSADIQLGVLDQSDRLSDLMTPSVVRVVSFARRVPGFNDLCAEDQILLLKSCCIEIMCLRAASRYRPDSDIIILSGGRSLARHDFDADSAFLLEPVFEFAKGIARLSLDQTEQALLAAVLLMQSASSEPLPPELGYRACGSGIVFPDSVPISDRSGLRTPLAIDSLQDVILGAFRRYVAWQRPDQPVHWARVLMKVTDLRTISTRYADRVLSVQIDSNSQLATIMAEVFAANEPIAIDESSKPTPPIAQQLKSQKSVLASPVKTATMKLSPSDASLAGAVDRPNSGSSGHASPSIWSIEELIKKDGAAQPNIVRPTPVTPTSFFPPANSLPSLVTLQPVRANTALGSLIPGLGQMPYSMFSLGLPMAPFHQKGPIAETTSTSSAGYIAGRHSLSMVG